MADHGEDYETGKGLKNARSPLSEGLLPPLPMLQPALLCQEVATQRRKGH